MPELQKWEIKLLFLCFRLHLGPQLFPYCFPCLLSQMPTSSRTVSYIPVEIMSHIIKNPATLTLKTNYAGLSQMTLVTGLQSCVWLACDWAPPFQTREKTNHLCLSQAKAAITSKIHPHTFIIPTHHIDMTYIHLFNSALRGDKHGMCVYQMFMFPDIIRCEICTAPSWMPSHIS